MLRCGDATWEFHDPDVTEVDLGTLGLEAEVAFFLGSAADAVDEFAIHGKLDDAIDEDDVVDVPLPVRLAAVFDGAATVAAWIIWGGV